VDEEAAARRDIVTDSAPGYWIRSRAAARPQVCQEEQNSVNRIRSDPFYHPLESYRTAPQQTPNKWKRDIRNPRWVRLVPSRNLGDDFAQSSSSVAE
jgi:hypothetical protein